jgi:hypothetical protein
MGLKWQVTFSEQIYVDRVTRTGTPEKNKSWHCLIMLVTKRDRWESTSQRASNVWVLLSECTYVYSWYECHVFTIEE